MFKDVELSKSTLKTMLKRHPNRPLKKPEEWLQIWHALIAIAQDGKLNLTEFPTAKKLWEEVCSRTDEALTESSIKQMIADVWKTFVGQ